MIQLYNNDIKEFLTLKKNSSFTYQFSNSFTADRPSGSYDFTVVNDSVLAKSFASEKYIKSDAKDCELANEAHFYNSSAFDHGDNSWGVTMDVYNRKFYRHINSVKSTPNILLLNNGKKILEGYIQILETHPQYSKIRFVSGIDRKLYEFFDNPDVLNNYANVVPCGWLFYKNNIDYFSLFDNDLNRLSFIRWWSPESNYHHRNCKQNSDSSYTLSWGTDNRLIYGQLKSLTISVHVPFPSFLDENTAAFCAPNAVHIDYRIRVLYCRKSDNAKDQLIATRLYIWTSDRWTPYFGPFQYIFGENLYDAHPCFTSRSWFDDSIMGNKGLQGLKVISVTQAKDGNMVEGEEVEVGLNHSVTVPFVGKEYSDGEEISVKNSFIENKFIYVEYSLKKDICDKDWGSVPSIWRTVPILPCAWSFLNINVSELMQCIGNNELNDNTLVITNSQVDDVSRETDTSAASGCTLEIDTETSDGSNQMYLQKKTNEYGNDFSTVSVKVTDIIPSEWDSATALFPDTNGAPIFGNSPNAVSLINVATLHHDIVSNGTATPVDGFLNHLHFNDNNYFYFSPFSKELTYGMLKDQPNKSVKIEFDCVNYNYERYLRIGEKKYVVNKAETSDFIVFKIEAYEFV